MFEPNTVIVHQEAFGALWAIGWLFTIGYLNLTFWKGVLALIIWPVYLGRKFRKPTDGGNSASAAN